MAASVGTRPPQHVAVVSIAKQYPLPTLDEVSRIESGFPHDFAGPALAYGNTFDLIDGPRR
jgi:hypothetical protein